MFLIKALAAGAGGGAERVVATVASALAARGHQVSVVSYDAEGSEDFYKVSSAVDRVRLGVGATTSKSGLGETIRRLAKLREAAAEWRPDVAVGFMYSAYIPLALALAGRGVPVIGSERTAYEHYKAHPRDNLILRLSAKLIDRITANGDAIRAGYPPGLARKMVVIPNPVTPAYSLADPVGGAVKTLLCVGGLRPEKDHRTLVEAFARVSPSYPAWRLKIVGEGSQRPALEQLAARLGVQDRLSLPGTTEDVEAQYREAQLFVLPSIYEAFPNCVAEALAHALPAVGFADCPGTNQLIVSGVNGMLAPTGERVPALASVLDQLMRDPERRRRMGQAGPESVARFSLDVITSQWEELLGAHARRACSPARRGPLASFPRSAE